MSSKQNKEIKEALDSLKVEYKDGDETKVDTSKYDIVVNYIKILNKKIEQLEDENLQNIAKIQTMVRRHNKEEIEIRKYGGIKIAEDILKPIDLFKKVLSTPVDNAEVNKYLMGFNMIAHQLDKALEDNGITEIVVKPGDKFDHNIHNANEAVENSGFNKNEIVSVISNGYKLYDKVIIHAVVKVAK